MLSELLFNIWASKSWHCHLGINQCHWRGREKIDEKCWSFSVFSYHLTMFWGDGAVMAMWTGLFIKLMVWWERHSFDTDVFMTQEQEIYKILKSNFLLTLICGPKLFLLKHKAELVTNRCFIRLQPNEVALIFTDFFQLPPFMGSPWWVNWQKIWRLFKHHALRVAAWPQTWSLKIIRTVKKDKE